MTISANEKVGLFIIILLFFFFFIYTMYLVYQTRKKKKTQGPDHLELYFDEHFRNIIDEWDLMPRSKVKTWKKDMNRKLKVVNRDIETLKSKKVSLNTRLNGLDKEMRSLEEF